MFVVFFESIFWCNFFLRIVCYENSTGIVVFSVLENLLVLESHEFETIITVISSYVESITFLTVIAIGFRLDQVENINFRSSCDDGQLIVDIAVVLLPVV